MNESKKKQSRGYISQRSFSFFFFAPCVDKNYDVIARNQKSVRVREKGKKNLRRKSIKSFPDDWMFISLNNDTAATLLSLFFALWWCNAYRKSRLILLRAFALLSLLRIQMKKEEEEEAEKATENDMKCVNGIYVHRFFLFRYYWFRCLAIFVFSLFFVQPIIYV